MEEKVKPTREKRKTATIYSSVVAGAKGLGIFEEAAKSITSGSKSTLMVNTQTVALF